MIDRRAFLQDATATAAALALPPYLRAQQSDLAPIFAQIERSHAESVQRLRAAPNTELIWASPRELLNIFQADEIGCHGRRLRR